MSNKRGKQLNKYVPDYVLYDLETTGISANYDEVIEISAVKVRGGKNVDEFSTLVNPGRTIPYGASAVNHIYDEMVAFGFPMIAIRGRSSSSSFSAFSPKCLTTSSSISPSPSWDAAEIGCGSPSPRL